MGQPSDSGWSGFGGAGDRRGTRPDRSDRRFGFFIATSFVRLLRRPLESAFSSLNLSKHRSVINAFVHIIAAITAYQINPFKPKLQPCYQLETTA